MREDLFTGRKCYDHLGGKLGAALFDFLLQEGWIELKTGTSTVYDITEKGYENFEELGLDLVRKS